MQKMANPLVQKITGTPDIDFTLPGREKCLYFVSFNDQDKSWKFLLALFFTLLCQELVNEADFNGGKLYIKVTLLLDEFYSLGIIPDFDIRLSNMRSRGIDCKIITQSLGQLQIMYPDNLWESILDCCSTWMLLQTNSKLTADYFSYRSGEQTVEDKGRRYEEGVGDVMKMHTGYQITESHGKRNSMTAHEVMTMEPDELMVVVSTHNVCKLRKVDYSRHPMNKEIREIKATEHKPDWIDNLTLKERAKFKVDKIKFNEYHELDNIELCTDEDFLEDWNNFKQKQLDRKIGRLSQLAVQKREMDRDNIIEDNYDEKWEICNSDGSMKKIQGAGISERHKQEAKKARQLGYEKEVNVRQMFG